MNIHSLFQHFPSASGSCRAGQINNLSGANMRFWPIPARHEPFFFLTVKKGFVSGDSLRQYLKKNQDSASGIHRNYRRESEAKNWRKRKGL